MSQRRALVDRLRKREHTGENRCTPCTVVNVVLAVLLSGGVALVSVPLAVPVLGLSLLVIYLRGYLVPYTPTLTTRYLPETVLRALGKEPDPMYTDVTWEAVEKMDEHRENSVDVDEFLLDDAGVVEAAPTGHETGDYLLTDAFAGDVDDRFATVHDGGVDAETVADLFDTDPADVSPKERDYPAYDVGFRVRKWPSEVALEHDVAIHRTMGEWTEGWADVPTEQRVEILDLLRASRRSCPACGGRLAETNETVESCCVSVEKYAFRCEDCEQHFREYSDPTERSGKGLTGH